MTETLTFSTMTYLWAVLPTSSLPPLSPRYSLPQLPRRWPPDSWQLSLSIPSNYGQWKGAAWAKVSGQPHSPWAAQIQWLVYTQAWPLASTEDIPEPEFIVQSAEAQEYCLVVQLLPLPSPVSLPVFLVKTQWEHAPVNHLTLTNLSLRVCSPGNRTYASWHPTHPYCT